VPAVPRRKAPELDQPRLLGIERPRKALQPLAHRVEEARGIAPVLEADDEVVGSTMITLPVALSS
jgi:hypothetical protein